jgi:hypothetical protein
MPGNLFQYSNKLGNVAYSWLVRQEETYQLHAFIYHFCDTILNKLNVWFGAECPIVIGLRKEIFLYKFIVKIIRCE